MPSARKKVPLLIWQWGLLLLMALFFSNKSHAISEQELKVVLILKIAKFSNWSARTDSTFNFCLYRGLDYEDLLSRPTDQTSIGGKPVRFLFLKDNSRLLLNQQCHVLFVTEDTASEVKQVLRKSSFSQTLTVSDFPGFAGLGGMVELSKRNNRYAIKIDLSVVRRSGIELSASLLEISTIINGDK
ncbi:MAG: YfiR family protein [Neptuniibacter sp.]